MLAFFGNASQFHGPDGCKRKNPFRNQIDYIAIKTDFRRFVTDSKSTSNFDTETDHRLVKMKVKFQWCKMQNAKSEKKTKICMENENEPQEIWNKVVKSCKEVSAEVLGTRDKKVKYKDDEITELSEMNSNMRK